MFRLSSWSLSLRVVCRIVMQTAELSAFRYFPSSSLQRWSVLQTLAMMVISSSSSFLAPSTCSDRTIVVDSPHPYADVLTTVCSSLMASGMHEEHDEDEEQLDGTLDFPWDEDEDDNDHLTGAEEEPDSKHTGDAGAESSVFSRISLCPNKAGMEGVDKEKANAIILEASKVRLQCISV
jgi:hypothetical protein